MPSYVTEAGTPKFLDASGNIFTGPGSLIGFLCSDSTSGTICIRHFDDNGEDIIDHTPVTAGGYYPIPAAVDNGAHAVLNSAEGTFFYAQ